MLKTLVAKNIYTKIQKQLLSMIPEKWDSIYLYASIIDRIGKLQTGEMFFYYFPKGLLKKNPINAYEIPAKFSLDEEEYIILAENLYDTIKELRNEFELQGEKLWTNMTLKVEGLKFTIEFYYDDLNNNKYSSYDRHIIWTYVNLGMPLDSFSRKDRSLILNYLEESKFSVQDVNIYTENVYKAPVKSAVKYNKEIELYIQASDIKEQKHKEYTNAYNTYVVKTRRSKEKHKNKEYNQNKDTYIEQIEKQRAAIKSQILNKF